MVNSLSLAFRVGGLSLTQQFIDCSTIVTKQLLQRAYENVVEKSTVAVPGSSQGEQHWDPDHHLFFINAFEMPRWHYSQERKVFEK